MRERFRQMDDPIGHWAAGETASEGPAAARIFPAQLQQLIEASAGFASLPSRADLWSAVAEGAAAILGANVAIFEKRDVWTLAAESASGVMPGEPPGDAVLAPLVEVPHSLQAHAWIDPGGTAWLLVAAHRTAVIAVEGDWMEGGRILAAWATGVGLVLQRRAIATRGRAQLARNRFARILSRTSGLLPVASVIVDRMARTVHARLGVLAIPFAPDRNLSVVATHGYPLELVEHLRIEPGVGVLGSVFQSGRPLHVRSQEASSRSRPRYRTDSFVAMPIRAGRESLGVVCVTDKMGDQPFTRADVSALRALVVPAALALARETALVEMEKYAYGAAIDPVSGTFNRGHFHKRLEEELQRSRRDGSPVALMMLDIDDFKSINDSFGHLAGDAVIKDIGEILRRSVRVFDVCARFGGEEFAIIMPSSNGESAAKVGSRIRERIEAYRPAGRSLDSLRVTASVGLAVSIANMSARDLIARADAALYLAKRAGKNRLRISEPAAPSVLSDAELGGPPDGPPVAAQNPTLSPK